MSSIQQITHHKNPFFESLRLKHEEGPQQQTMSMTDTLAQSKFTVIGPDGKEYKTYTNPDEWLLGGSNDGCCYSFCSWRDEQNNAAFACIGKTVCLIPAVLTCIASCGNVCNPICYPLCGRCLEPPRHPSDPQNTEMGNRGRNRG